METETFDQQAETDHHQEAEAEDDDRRVPADETHQRSGGRQHDADGDDDGDHHDRDVVDHADGGDDAVEREDEVEHDDLRDDLPEHRMDDLAGLMRLGAFEAMVQFHRTLGEQEGAAEDQDDVAARKRPAGQ